MDKACMTLFRTKRSFLSWLGVNMVSMLSFAGNTSRLSWNGEYDDNIKLDVLLD
jgi:hypothetical protein